MLRWLPSALYSKSTERQHFLQDILLFVFGAHVVLLLVMIGASMFDRKHDSYAISMHQSGATYVLMPLQKKVDQSQQKKRSGHASNKKSQVMNYEDYQRRKNIKKRGSTKVAKPVKAVVAPKAKNSLQTRMQQDRASAALVEERKSIPSKKNRLNNKKNKVKMVEAVAVSPVVQQDEQLLRASEVATPVTHEVVVAGSHDVKSAVPEQLIDSSDNSDLSEPFDTDNVVFVGYEQLDECVVGSKIQQSIQQCWTPPIGVSVGTSCQMRVMVSAQGVATTVNIEKSSGVFVYDTSARTALLMVEYPKEVWNKTIIIVLGN